MCSGSLLTGNAEMWFFIKSWKTLIFSLFDAWDEDFWQAGFPWVDGMLLVFWQMWEPRGYVLVEECLTLIAWFSVWLSFVQWDMSFRWHYCVGFESKFMHLSRVKRSQSARDLAIISQSWATWADSTGSVELGIGYSYATHWFDQRFISFKHLLSVIYQTPLQTVSWQLENLQTNLSLEWSLCSLFILSGLPSNLLINAVCCAVLKLIKG